MRYDVAPCEAVASGLVHVRHRLLDLHKGATHDASSVKQTFSFARCIKQDFCDPHCMDTDHAAAVRLRRGTSVITGAVSASPRLTLRTPTGRVSRRTASSGARLV